MVSIRYIADGVGIRALCLDPGCGRELSADTSGVRVVVWLSDYAASIEAARGLARGHCDRGHA